MSHRLSLFSALLLSCFYHALAAEKHTISLPSSVHPATVVYANFLGISFELSFVNEYFGNDTSTIPPTFINYLSAIRNRTQGDVVRVRIGGNSMDSSTYYQNQTSPMLELVNPNANSNNQPVNYGPLLWEVMTNVSSKVGGVDYLIGLSLLDPNNTDVPILAGAFRLGLGDILSAYLLGNEPDLYTSHGNRPGVKNYTVQDYMEEFGYVANKLRNTTGGDLLATPSLAGPTICCAWNLEDILTSGYLDQFKDDLKYITLQHYPQNYCSGSYDYGLSWYLQHVNVANLATWQQSGINHLLTTSDAPRLVMSEFNSASCGGIPNISDTFGVGSLWTLDYALALASVGYDNAYIHTRERGISYNLFIPPELAQVNTGTWYTSSPYYALLVLAEALQAPNGSFVVDLNVANSTTSGSATVGGYAVYDAQNQTKIRQLVLFNYNSSDAVSFDVSADLFWGSDNASAVTVKYLASSDAHEKINISWGGQSFAGVGDGIAVDASWAQADISLDCRDGCSVPVPVPAAAVVFVSESPDTTTSTPTQPENSGARFPWIPDISTFLVTCFCVLFTFSF
ncbi:hypothetical protein FISHEDRAFT_41784 [Fistulina hepatica ATCC 64428]|nr:hypothetical protein FISHEDRAFT_41784 [Fistulina hepatica ATCC 64428]